MENDKIHDYTDAYLESYLRALDKTHNSDLAILEIWADGSIQGYLSAKQTLRIIECVKARESPR